MLCTNSDAKYTRTLLERHLPVLNVDALVVRHEEREVRDVTGRVHVRHVGFHSLSANKENTCVQIQAGLCPQSQALL